MRWEVFWILVLWRPLAGQLKLTTKIAYHSSKKACKPPSSLLVQICMTVWAFGLLQALPSLHFDSVSFKLFISIFNSTLQFPFNSQSKMGRASACNFVWRFYCAKIKWDWNIIIIFRESFVFIKLSYLFLLFLFFKLFLFLF